MLRKKPLQIPLTVSRKEYLTPRYIRVFLQGDEVKKLAENTIGVNNKILIPPEGVGKVHFPELDSETMRWKPQPPEIAPIVRTYTHRGIDLEKKEIWIDFVAHGLEGPASKWAIEAKEGDVLGVMMKQGKKELYTQAEHYLLVGDATAIPVLGAILEDLPPTAKGICIIEVFGEEDEQALPTQADIKFIWLHNPTPKEGSKLADVFKEQPLPQENRFAYIATELDAVKAIRHYLRKEQNWGRDELYAYSFWKSGKAENESASTRRKEREEIQ